MKASKPLSLKRRIQTKVGADKKRKVKPFNIFILPAPICVRPQLIFQFSAQILLISTPAEIKIFYHPVEFTVQMIANFPAC
jgi:hypothetical protein